MGPPFITAEWTRGEAAAIALALASMGPPFITAEWVENVMMPRRALPASMGPPFITAEWMSQARGVPRREVISFNGAAVHHGGVVKRTHELLAALRASMGPPFITAEWLSTRSNATTRCRFNGAAVHHGGVAEVGDEVLSPTGLASMGPPFITAEWSLLSFISNANQELQWGRRSSRRSGPFACSFSSAQGLQLQWGRRSSRRSGRVADPLLAGDGGPSRFNGAAVHHGGVGLAQDANKFEESQRVLRAG